ncbi:restriction endonuclease subunit S [Clostridium neonatale]|uniref:restriction endonuclease subunit S n=1 Tax=Clostridium neonatale TaxID=137838 RepID=UPI003D32A353
MSENQKKVPKRRFKEFENGEGWEERELGKLVDVYDGTHQTPNYTDSGIMFLSVENIKTLQSEKFISEEDFERNFVIFPEKGDVLMTRIGDIGTANVVESDAPKAYYVSLALLKQKELVPYFLKESISSTAVKKELWKRTLHIAFPKKINKNEIANVIVPYPVSEEEQQKIGKLFQNINNLITLHQRKLEKMKTLKKAYLTDMFPAEGERKPKLRFPGFTDNWEQCKLGEIVDFLDEQRKPLESGTREPGEYPYYGASGIIDYVKDYLFDEELILLSEDGANIIDRNYRVCFLATGKYWVNNHAHVLKSKDSYCNAFICEALERLDYAQYNTGTAQPKLNQEVCRNINIMVPNFEEQLKIASYLTSFDNIITLHHHKLEKLKNIKKAYLNEMFI